LTLASELERGGETLILLSRPQVKLNRIKGERKFSRRISAEQQQGEESDLGIWLEYQWAKKGSGTVTFGIAFWERLGLGEPEVDSKRVSVCTSTGCINTTVVVAEALAAVVLLLRSTSHLLSSKVHCAVVPAVGAQRDRSIGVLIMMQPLLMFRRLVQVERLGSPL
jgi:hypothetical protein